MLNIVIKARMSKGLRYYSGAELFIDWTKLGVIDGKMPVRHKMARSWTAANLSE